MHTRDGFRPQRAAIVASNNRGRFLPRQYPSPEKFVIIFAYHSRNESMSAGRELTFVVFMMHILAAAWSMSPSEAYALCKRSGALDKYLVPHYDVLHSMGANALIEDITGYIRERGFEI